jgi:hypothetical protein
MANEIKLEVYTIRVRKSGETDKFLPLDRFINQNDFFKFFQDYISSFDHHLEINDVQKRSLILDSERLKYSSQSRMISGIIESGDYGYESTLYDIKSGEEQYKRKVDDTEIKPFYFLLYLPVKDNKGFLILQRFGIYGIHSIFSKHLTDYFKQKFSELQLDFNPFVSAQLAKLFLEKGNIKEFVLTRYNLPTDVIDRLGMYGHEEDIMSIELTIKARKNKFLPLNNRVERFIKNPNVSIFDLKEFESLGFDGEHKSKMVVSLGRNKRTVDLSDTANIRPYYDIDNEVQKDSSGHPVFESIDSIAKSLMTDLQTELNPDV